MPATSEDGRLLCHRNRSALQRRTKQRNGGARITHPSIVCEFWVGERIELSARVVPPIEANTDSDLAVSCRRSIVFRRACLLRVAKQFVDAVREWIC